MLKIYRTENTNLYDKLNGLLAEYVRGGISILFTENGKPYIEGNPLFFSLAHSGNVALIALCDKPVGVDTELKKDRKYGAVLSRFCEKEKREIAGTEDFLRHWVVREAYVKMLGATLAEKLSGLVYADGILSDNGAPVSCKIINGETEELIYSVCTENAESNGQIITL